MAALAVEVDLEHLPPQRGRRGAGDAGGPEAPPGSASRWPLRPPLARTRGSGPCTGSPSSAVPSAATGTRVLPVTAMAAGLCSTTRMVIACGKSVVDLSARTTGYPATAWSSLSWLTCSVVMVRAVDASAARTRLASSVLTPVTVTRSTLDERGVAHPEAVGPRGRAAAPAEPRAVRRMRGRRARQPPAGGRTGAERGQRNAPGGQPPRASARVAAPRATRPSCPLPPRGERSTSPRNWTSGSSSTPKRSRTRRRPSAIRAITSAVVASPMFSTKFACFSENPRSADREAAAAGLVEQHPGAAAPRARGSSGFLKVEPKVLIPDGCASRRAARMSARVAFTSAGSAGSRPNDARATTSPGRRFERR